MVMMSCGQVLELLGSYTFNSLMLWAGCSNQQVQGLQILLSSHSPFQAKTS